MDGGSSFLFAGTKFDKKRFARDFARFQVNKEINNSVEKLGWNDIISSKSMEGVSARKKKRKAVESESVEGFNVFRSSKIVAVNEHNESVLRNKEINRQIERDALLRKKYSIHVSGINVPSPLESFAEFQTRFKCKSYLLRNLAKLGFTELTPIQRQSIPVLLSGRECFACAPTGSGKTLAFVCPVLMKLKKPSKDGVRAVIICPTRELASQTRRESMKFGDGGKFCIRLLTRELIKTADFSNMPCDILISTPMRLKFAIRKRKLDLSRVEYLVLDESDKLFELGFLKEIDFIVKACTNPCVIRSLFSATLPDSVEDLARTIMHDAVRVIIGRKNSASEMIKQRLVFAGSEEGKLLALRQSFSESLNPPVLVFVQSKERAKELYNELEFENIRVDVIHADLSQTQREDCVNNFRAGKTWVLIATDVMARGMDFKGVNCVINFDFPESTAAYIHRIGRTGRAGRSGEAVTFYTEEDVSLLRNIANAMTASGCTDVPAWINGLPKMKWKLHRPRRDTISTKPKI